MNCDEVCAKFELGPVDCCPDCHHDDNGDRVNMLDTPFDEAWVCCNVYSAYLHKYNTGAL